MSGNNKRPICVMSLSQVPFTPRFEYGDQAQIAEISGAGDGTELGTGFGRFSNAEIPWTVQYDEVLLVLEGEVTVRTDAGDHRAGPMECVWLPKGTSLTYIARSALVFYAMTPTSWADGAA